MKIVLALTVVIAITPIVSPAAFAQRSCPQQAASLGGGDVYVNDGASGIPLASVSPLEGNGRRRIDLFYVVKTSPNLDRDGVIVIKSARLGVALNDDVPATGRVKLMRKDAAGKCRPSELPYEGSIPVRAYNDYHDLGKERGGYLDKPEEGDIPKNSLKRFHTAYPSPTGCRATDAKVGPDGFYVARNNRSQFSFDTTIVDTGMNEAAYNIAAGIVTSGWSLIFQPAIAQTERIREQSVEIKAYRTVSGFACIPFSIDPRSPKQILRVNDLEGRLVGLSEFRRGAQ